MRQKEKKREAQSWKGMVRKDGKGVVLKVVSKEWNDKDKQFGTETEYDDKPK